MKTPHAGRVEGFAQQDRCLVNVRLVAGWGVDYRIAARLNPFIVLVQAELPSADR
jgi:hypothetical protein